MGRDDSTSALLSGILNKRHIQPTSAARASEIHLHDIKLFVNNSTGYVLQFGKNTKTLKQGKPRSPIKFYLFTENKRCVFVIIDLYLSGIEEYDEKQSQLLSFLEPHGSISTSTLSGSIMEVLAQSDIDPNKFSAHSTRSAPSSKANDFGLPQEKFSNRVTGQMLLLL